MCTCKTAIRKRRQAANGYKHLAKDRRPKYSKISVEKSAARLSARIAKEKLMQGRKSKK